MFSSGGGGIGGVRFAGSLLARILGALVPVQRGEDDIEVAVPQHFRRRIGLTVKRNLFDEPVHHLEADLLVNLLAAFESQLQEAVRRLAEMKRLFEIETQIGEIENDRAR